MRVRSVPCALVLALALGVPAGAAENAAHRFLGVITAVSIDADPATADSLTFRVLRSNDLGDRWVETHPGDVTVSVTPETDATTGLRLGDGVRVLARKAGGGLEAIRVRLRTQRYHGTIVSFTGTSVTLDWDRANLLGEDWLAHNGSPATVTAAITPSTAVTREGGGTPVAGDQAELRARPASGGGLEATRLEAAPAA